MPAAHNVQFGAGWPPGLKERALHGGKADTVLALGFGLWVPAGQGVESPERAGQKQPRAQGMGREDKGQKKPGGQGSQPPVPLMKEPERQPERRKTSTVLE